MKFKVIIPKIEVEFEAESMNDAIGQVDSGLIDIAGMMFEKQKIIEVNEDNTIHKITMTQNNHNYLDPLHRQWVCTCNKILHTEREVVSHIGV